jgi:hypothetical protein
MIRGRRHHRQASAAHPEDEAVEIDAAELTGAAAVVLLLGLMGASWRDAEIISRV